MNKKYNVIVVGGGFAGTAAAVEAARKGLQVLLVEKFNCLGGAAAGALVIPFMNYWTLDPETDEPRFLAGSIFREIVEELKKFGALKEDGKVFDEEYLKLVLNRLCLDAGVELLFNTTVTGATVENGRICALEAWGKSRQLKLTAEAFVDATGDGELSVLAGCRCRVGREEDGLCQPMTLSFRLAGVDMELYPEQRARMQELYKEAKADGRIKNPRENILIFRTLHNGVLHFNTTRIVRHDPTDPVAVTRAEIEAREQVFELYHLLRDNIPAFKNSYVQATGLQIGIRESRMVEGEYTLKVDELKALARFPDAIAAANYDIDIHNPEGEGTSHYYFGKGQWYEIPYRCLVPKDCRNLLVAGRCISSDHEAQASYRIMPFCAQLGQAAGAAASLAVRSGVDMKHVDTKQLQEILRQEQFVI